MARQQKSRNFNQITYCARREGVKNYFARKICRGKTLRQGLNEFLGIIVPAHTEIHLRFTIQTENHKAFERDVKRKTLYAWLVFFFF